MAGWRHTPPVEPMGARHKVRRFRRHSHPITRQERITRKGDAPAPDRDDTKNHDHSS